MIITSRIWDKTIYKLFEDYNTHGVILYIYMWTTINEGHCFLSILCIYTGKTRQSQWTLGQGPKYYFLDLIGYTNRLGPSAAFCTTT